MGEGGSVLKAKTNGESHTRSVCGIFCTHMCVCMHVLYLYAHVCMYVLYMYAHVYVRTVHVYTCVYLQYGYYWMDTSLSIDNPRRPSN